MPEIYCKKCGLRGHSKCPYCRSIFPAHSHGLSDNDALRQMAQEYFENFVEVGLYENDEQRRKEDYEKLNNGESVRFRVSFWTYSNDRSYALASILERLAELLPLVNIKVAACIHEWEFMPGQESSIGCGHKGKKRAKVPPDPFAQ